MKRILVVLLMLRSVSQAAPLTETFYENSTGTPLLSLVEKAKKSLDIEIYEMDDLPFLQAVEAAVSRGVKVQIVKESAPVGEPCQVFAAASASDDASCTAQKALLKVVQKAGGKYIPFNHAALCGIAGRSCFEHGKILIADRAQALISTGNFNASNLCDSTQSPTTCNRDYSVVSTDPKVIATLESFFSNDVKGTEYSVSGILNSAPTQKLTVSPLSLNPLVSFLKTAKKKIQIQNQYLDDPDLNQAISDLAKQGIDVEVMVASACSFGAPSSSDARSWTTIYQGFDAAGVKTRIFDRAMQVNGVSGYLHAKAIVVDGKSAWVGSVNGSATSLNNNREYGIFLHDLSEVQKLQSILSADFADSRSESWQDSLKCANDPNPSPGPTNELRLAE